MKHSLYNKAKREIIKSHSNEFGNCLTFSHFNIYILEWLVLLIVSFQLVQLRWIIPGLSNHQKNRLRAPLWQHWAKLCRQYEEAAKLYENHQSFSVSLPTSFVHHCHNNIIFTYTMQGSNTNGNMLHKQSSAYITARAIFPSNTANFARIDRNLSWAFIISFSWNSHASDSFR